MIKGKRGGKALKIKGATRLLEALINFRRAHYNAGLLEQALTPPLRRVPFGNPRHLAEVEQNSNTTMYLN
jgi:hypothetical protein